MHNVLQPLQIHRRLFIRDHHALADHSEHKAALLVARALRLALLVAMGGLVAQAAVLHYQTRHHGALGAGDIKHLLHLGQTLCKSEEKKREHTIE